MRVLLVHNNYGNYATGGEKNVMLAEAKLLRDNGHDVIIYECTNDENVFNTKNHKFKAFYHSKWNPLAYRELKATINQYKPDIMHVHNYWYQLSPSIFKASYDLNVPSVITLHNYRLLCPGVLFLRNGKPCEDCMTKNPIRSVFFRCHSGSILKSLLSYRLYSSTKKNDYYSNYITGYIALTEFAKSKFVEGGIKESQIKVKPNFIPKEQIESSNKVSEAEEKYALYVGRVSREKGIENLSRAWEKIHFPLKIIGSGDTNLEEKLKSNKNIEFLGNKSSAEVFGYLKYCTFLVFPSIWYEGFPLTIIEALSMGKPIVASNLGARSEVVVHEETGLLFKFDCIDDFRCNIVRMIEDETLRNQMGNNAKRKFINQFSEDINIKRLESIYNYFIGLFNQ